MDVQYAFKCMAQVKGKKGKCKNDGDGNTT